MKKNKLITLSFLFILTTVVFFACKKTGVGEQAQSNASKQGDLAAIYKAKLKDQPVTATMVVNLPGKGYYADLDGNKITIRKGLNTNINRGTTFSCIDPADSEFSADLVSITREFTCNVGYRFVVQYKLETEIQPLYTNSSGQVSRGRIRLINASGGTVYTTPTTTINPLLSIQDNGVIRQNSNGDDVHEVVVTYRSEIISEALYNQSASVRSNLNAYTDCSLYPLLVVPFSSQQQVAGSQHDLLPCTRIDKAYWVPRNGSTPPSLAGCNPVGSGCFPWNYVYPHKQEIEFLNGSGVWKRFYLHFQGLGQPGTQDNDMINYWDVWYIDVSRSQQFNNLVPGNVQVRYRNNHMGSNSNGGPCVTQPTGTYITETWLIN